jgi:hypothetical protein
MTQIQKPKQMISQQLCQIVLSQAAHGLQNGAILLRWMFWSFGVGI